MLHYRYEMRGQGIDPPLAGHVDMDVREVKADGAKSVYFDMFEGQDRRQFGPIASQEQNPLVLVLSPAGRAADGQAHRRGGGAISSSRFAAPSTNAAEASRSRSTLGDRKAAGSAAWSCGRSADDPHIDRFPQFRDKAYEFVVADGVPGGLYQLVQPGA